jgi:hypothetical protein
MKIYQESLFGREAWEEWEDFTTICGAGQAQTEAWAYHVLKNVQGMLSSAD